MVLYVFKLKSVISVFDMGLKSQNSEIVEFWLEIKFSRR